MQRLAGRLPQPTEKCPSKTESDSDRAPFPKRQSERGRSRASAITHPQSAADEERWRRPLSKALQRSSGKRDRRRHSGPSASKAARPLSQAATLAQTSAAARAGSAKDREP